MAYRHEISTFVKDNGIDFFFVTETWLSAQGYQANTVELAPSGFDMKPFSHQLQSRGIGIATVCKSILGSNITFKTNFDFAHTLCDVVLASITLLHNTLHLFVCTALYPTNKSILLTMLTEQLPDLDYINNLPGLVCLVGDMNIHFDNPLQSLTKQTLTTLSLYGLIQVINKPTHKCGHIIVLLFNMTMTSMKNLLLQTHLNQTIIALNPTSTIYPSADISCVFIRDFTTKVEKLIANIASEPVASTLVTGRTTATFYSIEKVSQLTVKECILNSAPKSCDLYLIPSKLLIECLDYILPSLTDVFNSSLASSHNASYQVLSHLFSKRVVLITMM